MLNRKTETILVHPLCWLLFSALAIALIVWPNGIGLTHDSAWYVFGARSLDQYGSMLDPSGNLLRQYPPLYPFLLKLGLDVGMSVESWATILNGLAHVTLVLLCWYESKSFRSTYFRLAFLCCITIGIPVLQNAVFLWSDAWFVTLSVAWVVAVKKFLHSTKLNYLIFALACLIASFYQRHIGVLWVIAAGILILLEFRWTWRKRILISLLLGGTSALCWAIWAWRSNSVEQYPLEPAISTWWQNFFEAASMGGSYWVPLQLPASARVLLFLLLMGCGSAYLIFRRQKSAHDFYWPWLVMACVYGFGIVLLNSVFHLFLWEERYLSPLYPACMLFTFKLLDDIVPLKRTLWSVAISFVLIIYPVVRYGKNVLQWRRSAVGYRSVLLKEEPLTRWMCTQQTQKWLSNNPISLITPVGKECYFMPLSFKEPVVLVWWDKEHQLNYIGWGFSEYTRTYVVKKGPEFPEAKVYFLSPKNP